MLARVIAVAALVLLAPALAAAQADHLRGDDTMIEEDHVLSGELVTRSGGSPAVVAFRRELHDLDYRLRGRTRPPDLVGVGVGLIIPGGLAIVSGAVLLVVGSFDRAASAGACTLSVALGSHCTESSRDESLLTGGGVALGTGLLVLAIGLAVALSGRHERAAFDRRDHLREELRTWIRMAPTDGGAVFVLGGEF